MTNETAPRQITATITGLDRRNNTPDGNPRYLVTIDTQEAPLKTADDINDAHSINTYGPTGAEAGQPVTLTLNKQGEITHVSK